jgi:hypothetical protein
MTVANVKVFKMRIRKTTRLRNGKPRKRFKKRFDNGAPLPVKMRIDNLNLKHAVRQLFEKLARSSKKINNNTLKNGTTIEKLEVYFEDFLLNGLEYLNEDKEKLCPCIEKPYVVYGRCLTIPGIPPYQICIIYNADDSCCEIRWI